MRFVLATLAAGLLLGVASPIAAADSAEAGEESVHDPVADVLGASARLEPDGLYSLRPNGGEPVYTHGADPRPEGLRFRQNRRGGKRRGAKRRGGKRRGKRGAAKRPLVCASGHHLRVLYASTGAWRPGKRAVRGLKEANAIVARSAIAAGGQSADLRVACDARGRIRMTRLPSAASTLAGAISAAAARGYRSPGVDHLIFLQARSRSACGAGTLWNDESVGPGNDNNNGVGYGIVYRGCWKGEQVLHEIGHLQGAVQYAAPFSTGRGGHCSDEADVMCYAPDGGDLNQRVMHRCAVVRFDCGADTYFDPNPEKGEYLETHWNLGSPANQSLTFGG